MKKCKYELMQLIVFVALLAWLAPITAQAASFRPLTEQEKAHLGATHVATITYADFTETNTNTAVTLTNVFSVAAKQGVQLMAMQLKTAFTTGNTNYTGSVLVTVGDGADADLYLTSTELDSDGTEVFIKFGRSVQAATSGSLVYAKTNAPAVTITLQTVSLTDTNGVTALCVTNVTATATVTPGTNTVLSALTDDVTGRKVYTTADNIDFTFTPNAEEALDALTAGEVRFYFKITP
jgi:hypothetical protein